MSAAAKMSPDRERRPGLVAFLLIASVLCAAAARAGAPPDSTAYVPGSSIMADSVAAMPVDTTEVARRDAVDLLRGWFHRPISTEMEGTSFGIDWSLLPTISYNPVYGFAFGVLLSGAGRLGPNTTRYSQLAVSANYSSEGQLQAQVRGDMYEAGGNYLAKIDLRYLDTERSTWGLGTITPDQQEYPMEFALWRAYATLYRRASGPVFVGVGYHYDEYQDIVDQRAAAGESTPFSEYSGGVPSLTRASGLSLNVLADTRDNLVNPTGGYYLSWSTRDYPEGLGSDKTWQELLVEMRVYPHVPRRSDNVLAFWLYGWMTFGPAPYLNLPADGWDTYGRGARGYLQGRIRGANQIYFETEYRFGITRDGLLGGVAFFNATMTTDPDTQVFSGSDHAVGVGLRLKFNKHTNTNLAIDHGWGEEGSRGWFLGMAEVF